jgi:outer membrane autotransporter protein
MTHGSRRSLRVGLLLATAVPLLLLAPPAARAGAPPPPPPPLTGDFATLIPNILGDCGARFTGSLSAQLAALCGASVSTGGSITSQTPAAQTEAAQTLLRRLEEQRRNREGGPSASADSSSLRGLGFFANAEYERFDKDVTTFEAGHDSNKYGGTIGVDYTFGRTGLLGLAVTGSTLDGKFTQSGGTFDIDAYGVLLYGSLLPIPHLFIDGVASYTRKDLVVDRAVVVPAGRGIISSDTDADEYGVGMLLGYDFVLQSFTIGPRAGVTYRRTDIDSFSERGSTGLELSYASQREESLTTSLGLFASWAISTPIGVVIPQTTAEWIHEFEDDQRRITFSFVGDSAGTKFAFFNDPPDRDSFNVGGGVVMVLPGGFSPFVNYRALVGYRDQTRHTVTVGLRFAF